MIIFERFSEQIFEPLVLLEYVEFRGLLLILDGNGRMSWSLRLEWHEKMDSGLEMNLEIVVVDVVKADWKNVVVVDSVAGHNSLQEAMVFVHVVALALNGPAWP